jgi:hypothetical protein
VMVLVRLLLMFDGDGFAAAGQASHFRR